MTEEQIAELGRVIDRADNDVADDDLGWSYQRLAEAVPRLLAERAMLLKAAHVADECPGLCSRHTEVAEAIAFAEAPEPKP